ncbi:hypothetical protein ACFL5Z_12875 [Planctomycetota bacterium]
MITGSTDPTNITPQSITPRKIAIANGERVPPEKMCHLNAHDYDLVLDYIARKLLARKDPDNHTKLEQCDCRNIGKDRLRLLRYMLENLKAPICEETIPYIYGDVASMTPNALAKAVGDLRTALWDGPYIRTEKVWGESVSRTGSVYLLRDKYQYLVIRYEL